MRQRNVTKTAWYRAEVARIEKDAQANGTQIARTFFEQADRTENTNPDAQALTIDAAITMQREWGWSLRDAAERAERELPKGSTTYHRHWQIAKAIVDGIQSPEEGWTEAVKSMSLRAMVGHIQAVKGKGKPEEGNPLKTCTRLAKLLLARIDKHRAVYNVEDVLLEYLTGYNDVEALKLLTVKQAGQAIVELQAGEETMTDEAPVGVQSIGEPMPMDAGDMQEVAGAEAVTQEV
jgi:hypothetical protein